MSLKSMACFTLACALLSAGPAHAAGYLPIESAIAPFTQRVADINRRVAALSGVYAAGVDSASRRDPVGHEMAGLLSERRVLEAYIQQALDRPPSPFVLY